MMLRFTSVVPPAIVSERVCMSRSPQLPSKRGEAEDAGGDESATAVRPGSRPS